MKPVAIPALIRRILLVDELTRESERGFRSRSLPGHLIHVMVSGEVEQRAEGRPEVFREGNAVWYHESEPVEGRIVRAPWRFITINFDAPDLAPPADARRVLAAGPATLTLARRLLEIWRDADMAPVERQLQAMIVLSRLILEIRPADTPGDSGPVYPANLRDRWWAAEKKLRASLDRPLRLADIAEVAGMSERTVVRACKSATGQPPAQRLRELRHAYAMSLLKHTRLSVTDIALRVGFSRVQEFSRECRSRTGLSPVALRRAPPHQATSGD